LIESSSTVREPTAITTDGHLHINLQNKISDPTGRLQTLWLFTTIKRQFHFCFDNTVGIRQPVQSIGCELGDSDKGLESQQEQNIFSSPKV
jgi:hypothetical protein